MSRLMTMLGLLCVCLGLGMASVGAETVHPEWVRTLAYFSGTACGILITLPHLWDRKP